MTDWNALSSIATLLMAIVTFLTLLQGRKQLKELKRQWDEQHKPKVIPVLLRKHDHIYIRLTNTSQSIAYGITVDIEKTPDAQIDSYDELKEGLRDATFTIEPNGVKDLMLYYNNWKEKIYNGSISITIKYNLKYEEIYTLHLSELNVLEIQSSDFSIITKNLEHIADEIRQKRF